MTKFIDSGAAKLRIEEAATKKQVSCGFRLRSMSSWHTQHPNGMEHAFKGDRCYVSGPEKRALEPASLPFLGSCIARRYGYDETHPTTRVPSPVSSPPAVVQARIDSGQERIVGVNCHRLQEECEPCLCAGRDFEMSIGRTVGEAMVTRTFGCRFQQSKACRRMSNLYAKNEAVDRCLHPWLATESMNTR